MNRVFAVALVLILGACSAGSVRKDLQTNPALSCVSGDLANALKLFFGNEAHAALRLMDGEKVGARNSICVEPGIHYITTGAGKNWLVGSGYMRVSMEAGKRYKLRAEFEETTFLIRLMETSPDGGETEIQRQRVTAGGAGR